MATISKLARDALNSRLRRYGYLLRWVPPRALWPSDRTIELGFPLVAAHLMLTVPQPYFIGIGANDGVTHDPLYPFVRDFGWRGVMVEPIPEAFGALERNYAGFPGVALVNAAVGESDGQGTIYTIAGSAPEAETMSLHSSFSRDMLLRGSQWHPDIESHVVERTVPIVSFPTLLRTADSRAVDVLKIDTEGYDLKILETIDLTILSPRLILAEHANLSKPERLRMADILLDHGYRVSMTSLDMIGYKPLAENRP
jgi:FkbM family methyltransferase